MRKINRTDVLKIVLVLGFVSAIGVSVGAIGRFTPTHAIVEPVYCGACHPDQIVELNATTHLAHFSGAVIEEAEAINAGTTTESLQAEAISGGCMMCHNTWGNREKIFLTNFNITDLGNNNSKITYNDINVANSNASVIYNVAITSPTQFIRLGSSINTAPSALAPKLTVQVPGGSGLLVGTVINATANSTGVTLAGDANDISINGTGTVKITYTVTGTTVSFKDAWGQLSGLSPKPGYFFNDQTGAASCGNPEKALCHAVEITVGKNMANQLQENTAGANGAQLGSGNGIYFQHDMAYTSAEYQAKQVKLCGVCHVDKLPPMDADGNPIQQTQPGVGVFYKGHGATPSINTTGASATIVTSKDWAHRQVQCIRCHSHAGIGDANGITGVKSQ